MYRQALWIHIGGTGVDGYIYWWVYILIPPKAENFLVWWVYILMGIYTDFAEGEKILEMLVFLLLFASNSGKNIYNLVDFRRRWKIFWSDGYIYWWVYILISPKAENFLEKWVYILVYIPISPCTATVSKVCVKSFKATGLAEYVQAVLDGNEQPYRRVIIVFWWSPESLTADG